MVSLDFLERIAKDVLAMLFYLKSWEGHSSGRSGQMNASDWVNCFFRIATVPLLLLFVGVPAYCVYKGNNTAAGIMACVLASALLFTRISDIAEFSLWEVKVKLEKTVNEAKVTIDELRDMASAFAESNLDQMAMSGQLFSALNTERRFAVREKIVGSLRKLGVDDKDILKIQAVWISPSISLRAQSIGVVAAGSRAAVS